MLRFYAEAEDVLAALPRRDVSMILREVSEGISTPSAFPTMQHKVQRLRKKLGLRRTSRSMPVGTAE